MNTIAEIDLYCVRESESIPFTVSISKPYQEGDDWRCKVSFGELLKHDIKPLYQVNSLLSLSNAICFVVTFLEKRVEQGDQFYFDEKLEEIINISDLFLGR